MVFMLSEVIILVIKNAHGSSVVRVLPSVIELSRALTCEHEAIGSNSSLGVLRLSNDLHVT